jgi:protein-tyrosine kinase
LSIIEQAAKRLEELRRSGVNVAELPRHAPAGPRAPAPGAEDVSTIRKAVAEAARVLPQPEPETVVPTKREERAPASPFKQDSRRSQQVTIDLKRLAAEGYLTPGAPRSQLADEFRVIKRPLLANALGKSAAPVERGNLIMVTSSLPGEGKTFTAVNLAMSLALELDTTVLLVDADVSRPSVLPRLGLRASRGLLDLLTDSRLDVSEVLLRTNVDKLTLLPAGAAHSQATELLASEAMNRLLDELATRYTDRILVFDAPPLLPSTESRVLATHMGQVITVVAAESTSQNTVQQALATIESCPIVMTLLNKVPRSEVGSYYGYYGPAAE